MGEVRLLGCPVYIVGDMARELLVALRTCTYIRPPHHQEGEVAVLEERV